MTAEKLLQAVAVTAELTQTQMSSIAQAAMVEELLPFDTNAVFSALTRCRRELRNGQFTLGSVMDRLDDGRPGADEAWAIALSAQDEQKTVVWCGEIQQAFSVARPLLDSGDKVGARMAFRDAYERMVKEARLSRQCAKWNVSLGWDHGQRVDALTKAVSTGLLTNEAIAGLLPASGTGVIGALLLDDKSGTVEVADADVIERCKAIKAMLNEATEASQKRREKEESDRRDEFERKRAEALSEISKRTEIAA